jgi:hypothetical protein
MATNLITGLGGPAGFGENLLSTGDFASTAVDLRPVFARGLTLFGVTYTQLFVNGTGSVSFGGDAKNVNLGALSGASGVPIFAPFIADIVTGNGGAATPGGLSTGINRVWYDLDPATNSFTVTWDDVRGYLADPLANAFQLRITGVPDAAGAHAGDFNVEYRYESIAWTTGGDQGGTDGLGGSPARAGYSAGNGRDYLELPASGNQAALLALDTASNVADPGRFLFQSRAGLIAPVFSADSVRVAEGSAATPGQALVTVTLSTPLNVPATVRYTTEAGSAAAGSDFAPRFGILTFAPGLTTQTVLVDLVGDDVAEGQESFTFALSEPSAGAKAVSGTVTILADDGGQPPLTLLVTDAQALESNGTVNFVLRLSAPQASEVTGFYIPIAEQSTASAADVTIPETGLFTFAPGQTQITVSVPVLPDAAVEGNEHFTLNFIAGPVAGTFPARGIILDDDGFTISDAAVTEAEGATVTFTVSRMTPLFEQSTVSFGTSSGTAGAGMDYTGSTGTLTFAPGVTSQTITIPIRNDTFAEREKQFTVVLSGASENTGIARGVGTATLTDDDGLRIADLSVAEGTNNKVNTVFMSVTLPQAAPALVTVDYKIEAGTGDPGITDITAKGRSGTLTFAPGQTKADLPVGVIGDSNPEPDETFRVVLSNPGGASGLDISDGSATLTIVNDDGVAPLVATIASQTVSEGSNTGTQAVPMTVFLNRLSEEPVEVAWTLNGGTATPAFDFVQDSGTVVIPAGKLSAVFPVEVMRDATIEPDETLTVRITKFTEGSTTLGTTGPDATLTLANDDTTFTVVYPMTSLTEAEWAANPFEVTIERAGDLSLTQVVGWEIPSNTFFGSPVSAGDFNELSNTVTFAPGQTKASFLVLAIDDTEVEQEEGFIIALSQLPPGGQAGTSLNNPLAIRNDDTSIKLLAPFTPYVGLESGLGSISTPRFHVELEGDLSISRQVTWTITGTGSNPADAADFKAMTGTLALPAKASLVELLIPVLNDAAIEPNEGYTVTLSNAGPGVTFTQASAASVIANDDYKASLSIVKASRAEGTGSGSTDFAFTVTLDPAPPRNFVPTFGWKVGPGTASGTVSADAADFVGGVLPQGTVAVGLNNATATIIVPVARDTAAELNESFTLTLIDGATGLEVGKAQATILNDDTNLSIAATSANKPEGSGPSPTPYTFTVTRTGNLSQATTAAWSTAGSTGSGTLPANAADFAGGTLPSGTVSFAAGQKTQLITVNVAADRAVENNERFAVTLASPSAGATITTATAGGIIQNDDATGTGAFSISRLQASRSEGQSGSTDFTFLVTRSLIAPGTAAVDWVVTGGGIGGTNPTAASDFAAGVLPRGSVSFAAGDISKPITIQVKGDTGIELNESFTVTLGNASQGTTLVTPSATGLVWNDDSPGTGTLSIARLAAQRAEGGSGSTAFTFTVSRTGVLTGTASADWAVTGGGVSGTNAAGGADFAGGQLPSGRVAFLAGQASAVVTVNVAGDIVAELNESFTVTLGGVQAGVTLGTASATGTILNDDIVSTPDDDTLRGTAGVETFVLGGGVDTLLALGGRDLFLFQPSALGDGATNATFIGDFSPTAGETLDLSAIDAITGGANDAFTFIGTAAFTGPGQLRWEDIGALRAVYGSTDADATPELSIFLSNPGPVQANWFVL